MQIQQITSKENAKLKAAAKLVHSKKERVATGSFLAEGCRLCTDALNSGRRPLRVLSPSSYWSGRIVRDCWRPLPKIT